MTMCFETFGAPPGGMDYVCTLGRGHDGVHVAHGTRDQVVAAESPAPSLDLLASFRAYIRAAKRAEDVYLRYRDGAELLEGALLDANRDERVAREAHETALRAVCER